MAITNTVTMPASVHAASVIYEEIVAPGEVVLISPVGNIGANDNPTYTWNEAENAETYIMGLDGPGVNFNDLVVADASDCSGGICSATIAQILIDGEWTWWILPSNPGYGDGNWSDPLVFTVSGVTACLLRISLESHR